MNTTNDGYEVLTWIVSGLFIFVGLWCLFLIKLDDLLEIYWQLKLNRIKKKTNTLALHTYPPDSKTGWRKLRSDYFFIKNTQHIINESTR